MIVRVYSKPNCWQCSTTIRKLDLLGVEYVVEDATDPQTVAALKELGYLSAPVVCVGVSNDDMWSGYRPDHIEEIAKRIHGA